MSSNDAEYFRQRAEQELAAAEIAATDVAAAVHRELAQQYLDLAGQPRAGGAAPMAATSEKVL